MALNSGPFAPIRLPAYRIFGEWPHSQRHIQTISFLESLKGARVLVTGASTGIGEQLAYHYARLGAQLVITARRGNVLEQVSCVFSFHFPFT